MRPTDRIRLSCRATAALLLLVSASLCGAQAPSQTAENAAEIARQWVATPAQITPVHSFGRAAKIHHRVYQQPRPLRVWIAEVDLTAPGVRFAVTQPASKQGEFETRCSNTLEFARQRGVQIAVNASAFRPFRKEAGELMDVVGLAAVRGDLYSEADERFGALFVSRDGRITLKGPPLPTDNVWHVVPGFRMLLDDGQVVVSPEVARSKFGGLNPRTAVGTDPTGRKLWLAVVDGRQPGASEGITLVELATLFECLGAWDALNLDGGGSTTLVLERRDATHTVVNTPVGRGAPGTLRQVANNLGLYLPGTGPSAGEPPTTLRDAVIRLAMSRRGGGYKWAGGGVTRDVVYDGKTLLRANPEGTYCCGATLELFLDAYCRVRHAKDRASVSGRWFEDWPQEKFVALQQGWYGTEESAGCALFPEPMRATIRERQVANVLPWAGLAEPVSDYRLLERGDFVEFWRASGGGHSVVFWGRDYDDEGRERLWYWSSQPKPRYAYPRVPGEAPVKTPGHGVNWEHVGEEIDPQRIYGVRLVEMQSKSASTIPAKQQEE
jgi:hypothetical protein